MSRRYFLETPIAESIATLSGDEAKHLAKVLRAVPGDQVILFAGDGIEHLAEIVEIRKSLVTLSITESRDVCRESERAVQLAVALPKGDRQRYLIEKCVELGVTTIIPLVAERSVAQPAGNALDRCRRYVIEASKQCGRNRLLQIGEPCRAIDYWPQRTASNSYIAHPATDQELADRELPDREAAVHVAIGPEGGFTESEVVAAQDAGWQLLNLGPRILRVETAAVAVAAKFC
jgi:16S rRNA (uracil1498-N3)-methyltransferase